MKRFGSLAEHLIATEPVAELVSSWNERDGAPQVGRSARAIGQIPICWDPDRETAVARAHEQFRWFAGGWAVNSELPAPHGFAGASQFVHPDEVAEAIPCGPDLNTIVEAVRAFCEASFTDIASVQVDGQAQQRFLIEALTPLPERLRSAAR